MNIFILDKNLKLNAQFHCDKHVVKMLLEQVQMLMSSYYFSLKHLNILDKMKEDGLYNLTHKNHPCSIWTRESFENWLWLYESTLHLNSEYMYRFNHDSNHLSLTKINLLIQKYGYPILEKKGLTPFAQAMPEEYRNEDAYLAYRAYYNGEKQSILKYTKRNLPEWIIK